MTDPARQLSVASGVLETAQGWTGRLVYRRRSTGEERGREDFQLTHNLDGTRTLRCLARTDDSRFLRDAVSTVSAEGRPLDTFIRLHVAERWVGSGYLRTHGDHLRVVVDKSADEGADTAAGAQAVAVDQKVSVPSCFHIMTHAVMHDGWTFWAYDEARAGRQDLTVYNTSRRWDGTDGPDGRLEVVTAERLEEGSVETPAGRFDTTRYRLVSESIGSPPCELSVSKPHNLLVRFDWPGFDLVYELESLSPLG